MYIQVHVNVQYTPVNAWKICVYSTLALGKERELVKEETALRKGKEAVCCYVYVDVHV